MKKLNVKTVFMDVDGTMTVQDGSSKIMELSPLRHLVNLVVKKHSCSASGAEKRILACGDIETQCLSEFLGVLEIEPADYFNSMKEDVAKHISIPDDTKRFFKFLKERGTPLYAATTNSPFMTRVKLAAAGLADLDSCPWLTGYYPGCFFRDPEGKFSPSYYSRILAHGGFDGASSMMIGDEPPRDMLPAVRSGFAFGVNIDRNQPEPCIERDGCCYVNSLDVAASLFA